MMPIIASEALLREKIQVQHYPFYANLTFACKTETLGSWYSNALLILIQLSKSKYQVVHEQKFKDLLSRTCQVRVERIVLKLESEAIRGLGSLLWGFRPLAVKVTAQHYISINNGIFY